MPEPRALLRPEPGFWLVRLAKGAVRVPAAIEWHETVVDPDFPENDMRGTRFRYLAATINGEPAALDDVWLYRGEPISRQEYRYRLADSAHAREWRPDDPLAQPRKAIDLFTVKPPF